MIFNFKMNRGGFGYRRAGVCADAAAVHRERTGFVSACRHKLDMRKKHAQK